MGKSYTLEESLSHPQEHTNQGCELTSVNRSAQVVDSTSACDVKTGTLEEDVTWHDGLPPGVKPGEKGDPFRTFRYTKQFCLIGVWMCIGLSSEIVGPTLPDLTERLCVDYEEISRALLGKSIGVGIGSIVGGFCNEVFYNQIDLFMSLSLFLMAVACACLPQVDSLAFVFTMLMLNGFGDGIINTGGNTMEMHLWGVSVAPHMHALHFGFGLGALIAPQIARPFLSPDLDEDNENYTVCVNGTSQAEDSRIEIAYGIIGIIVFLFAIVIMIFYIRGPPEGYPKRIPNKSLKKLLSASSCSRGYNVFAIQVLILLFFFFMQAIGGERAFGKFLFSFAIEAPVQFTKDNASYLMTAFWASFTFGRLMGVPVAKFMSINHMIVVNITGAFITAVVLSIWGATVSEVLWIFTCFMGIFIAVVFPNGMSWSNMHLDMNSMAVMLLVLGGACGGFIYQAITGSLFENVGPETLMYVMVGYALAMAVVYCIMQGVVWCHIAFMRDEVNDPLEDETEVIEKEVEKEIAEDVNVGNEVTEEIREVDEDNGHYEME